MKTKQTGSMLVAVLATLGVIGVLAALVVMVLFNANNTANALEKRIQAEHKNNKNVLAQYSQKVLEAAQVPTMMRNDVAKVTEAAVEGRYGKDGSKAVFQAIAEQNPTLDSKVYVKIQQIVEAGRDEFKTAQTKLISVKQTYETALGALPGGLFMKFMGYPRINLDDYNTVTTTGVEESFKAGVENAPIQLRSEP